MGDFYLDPFNVRLDEAGNGQETLGHAFGIFAIAGLAVIEMLSRVLCC
ncbi:MAG: hypothetical protein MI684_10905 [Chlorobiales bacterium]|nr:hypothetical protein [Chlorobiales bacterium]